MNRIIILIFVVENIIDRKVLQGEPIEIKIQEPLSLCIHIKVTTDNLLNKNQVKEIKDQFQTLNK